MIVTLRGLAEVRYDHCLRFALPFVGIVFVGTGALLAVGTASGRPPR